MRRFKVHYLDQLTHPIIVQYVVSLKKSMNSHIILNKKYTHCEI